MKKLRFPILTFFTFLLMLFSIVSCVIFNTRNKANKFAYNPVIAHRGAWKSSKLPQNSLASLHQAIKLKCYGSEFDVHLTKDDVLVVNHDHEFYGINIESATYEELLGEKLSNGETIPTLEAYLTAGLKQSHTKLIIEIKPSKVSKERTLKAAELVVDMVKELKAEGMVEYISFSYDALKKIRESNPKAKVSYLNGVIKPSKLKEDGMTGLDYRISAYKKNPSWIKESHELGLTVNVWTVNSIYDINYFISEGVDFITTDEPEILFNILQGDFRNQ